MDLDVVLEGIGTRRLGGSYCEWKLPSCCGGREKIGRPLGPLEGAHAGGDTGRERPITSPSEFSVESPEEAGLWVGVCSARAVGGVLRAWDPGPILRGAFLSHSSLI